MAEYVPTAEDREVIAQTTDDEALIKVARRRFELILSGIDAILGR